MIHGITDNGIKYDMYVTGPQGARFELYTHDGHTREQIEAAKNQIRREQDVVKFYVIKKTKEEWMKLKMWLHPISSVNDKLNEEFHAQL